MHYQDILYREHCEGDSFCFQLRGEFVWDRKAFERMIEAMHFCCRDYEQSENLPRWLALLFWDISDFVEGVTSSEHQLWRERKTKDPAYYTNAYTLLRSLSYWFFTGERYQSEKVSILREYKSIPVYIPYYTLGPRYIPTYIDFLSKEWKAEKGSFHQRLREENVWDRDLFQRMTEVMAEDCKHEAEAAMHPRWLVVFYWRAFMDSIEETTQNYLLQESAEDDSEYYKHSFHLLKELSIQFFMGG